MSEDDLDAFAEIIDDALGRGGSAVLQVRSGSAGGG